MSKVTKKKIIQCKIQKSCGGVKILKHEKQTNAEGVLFWEQR